jgi:hypothetical protein
MFIPWWLLLILLWFLFASPPTDQDHVEELEGRIADLEDEADD